MKNTKVIFKEIFIILLVLIAIFLILAIILYGYSPTRKIIPTKIEYSTPENIKEEIGSSDVEQTTPVTITYELDETHIDNSKKSGSYNSGKQNPFAKPVEKNEEGTEEENKEGTDDSQEKNSNTNSTQKSSVNTNNASSEKNSSNTKNETHYLPETGTK